MHLNRGDGYCLCRIQNCYAGVGICTGIYNYSVKFVICLLNLKLNTTNMVVINKKRNEVRPITLKELKDYKTHGDGNYYIVAYMSYQSPSAVYVYER